MNASNLDHQKIRQRLAYPMGKLRVVIDTDAANEVDDQFAIAWALRSPERLHVEAIYAAPFNSLAFDQLLSGGEPVSPETLEELARELPDFAPTPAQGMEQSYREIMRLLRLLGEDMPDRIFRGSAQYLADTETPVESEAARDLVCRAKSGDGPLYVLAIGSITNVASALLMDPSIRERIVVIWLGGQPLYFPQTIEYNLMQDVAAAQVVLNCGVPLVLVPCMTVASHLVLTKDELEQRLDQKSPIGSYLAKIVLACFQDEFISDNDTLLKNTYLRGLDDCPDQITSQFRTRHTAWSRVVWDIAAVAYLLNPNWCLTALAPSPILLPDMTWRHDPARHPIRVCNYINRDPIFGDLFAKLSV